MIYDDNDDNDGNDDDDKQDDVLLVELPCEIKVDGDVVQQGLNFTGKHRSEKVASLCPTKYVRVI
jgi:hypothetical protein